MIGEIYAQQSASGIGVLSDLDAISAPAVTVDSAVVFDAIPAPYGLPELSTFTVVAGPQSPAISAWMSGYTSAEHSKLSFGVRRPWVLSSGFSLGTRVECTWMVFRGFADVVDLRVGVHALMLREDWKFGVAIDDIVVVGREPLPWLRCSAGYSMDDLKGAVDVIMNGVQDLAVMLTTRWDSRAGLIAVGSVCTSPLTIRLDVKIDVIEPADIIVGFYHVEDLGLSPHLAVRWPW
ncbi:MAG TPA: hypothetical protein VK147_05665 [Candidatus Didemnitutus sp.]|nr:hypothetical protein [Candidatus Didemnitutus sp.]